jgi:hypothetical protein
VARALAWGVAAVGWRLKVWGAWYTARMQSVVAYRAHGSTPCAGCGESLRDGYELSPSTGDALCGSCFTREGIATADATVRSSKGSAIVYERRCSRCGGVASAGKILVHESRVISMVGVVPVMDSRVQNGAETEFRCETCGHGFWLLNRSGVWRKVQLALVTPFLGALIGAVASGGALNAGIDPRLAAAIFFVVLSGFIALGAAPIARDTVRRWRHPPSRAA